MSLHNYRNRCLKKANNKPKINAGAIIPQIKMIGNHRGKSRIRIIHFFTPISSLLNQ
jgi:hypothetical protein